MIALSQSEQPNLILLDKDSGTIVSPRGTLGKIWGFTGFLILKEM